MKKLLLLTALLGFIAAPAIGQNAIGTLGPGAAPCAYTDCKVKSLALTGGGLTVDSTGFITSTTATASTLNGSMMIGGNSADGSVYLYRGGGFGAVEVRSGDGYSWSSSASNPTATPDVNFSRASSTTVQVGTGGLNASGSLNLTNLTASGAVTVASGVATPAAGSTSARLLFGTTAGFGIYYGSGAPTVSAAQGSIYLRSDGSSTSTRLYINTTGSTTWTNVTTAG